MSHLTITIEIPGLEAERLPDGRLSLAAAANGRSFVALVQEVPGVMDYKTFVGDKRNTKGWTACDTPEDVVAKVGELLVWVAIGMPCVARNRNPEERRQSR